jgi:hypothetical protein
MDNFLPMTNVPGKAFTGYLDASLTVLLMACALVILAASGRAWMRALRGEPIPLVAAPAGPSDVSGPTGCC